MFYAYIIFSQEFRRYYIGSTGNIQERIKEHNAGKVQSTKKFRPWILAYEEFFQTRTEARKREIQIKKFKGGRAFKKLLENWVGTEAVKRDRL